MQVPFNTTFWHYCWAEEARVFTPATTPFLALLTPSEVLSSPTGLIKPWFHTEGKLSATLIIPSSWGLPTNVCIARIKQLFLAPLPGRGGTSGRSSSNRTFLVRGESSLQQGDSLSSNLFTLLLSCLVYFYLVLFALFIKNTKKLVTCI